MNFIILFILSYVVGSINFSIILFKILGKEEPREKFSGNPGTTNVYRQTGLWGAALVLFLDIGRSVLVTMLSIKILPYYLIRWIGFGLILGNRFPYFHKFKGGKGVANFLGFTIMISPIAAGTSVLAWIVSYIIIKIPLISTFLMIFILTFGIIFELGITLKITMGTIFTLLFIIMSHKQNIEKKFKEGLYNSIIPNIKNLPKRMMFLNFK